MNMMVLVNGRTMIISNIRMQSFPGTILDIYYCNNNLYYILTWLHVLLNWGEPCTSLKFEWRQLTVLANPLHKRQNPANAAIAGITHPPFYVITIT